MSDLFQLVIDKYNELNEFGRHFGMEITKVEKGYVEYEMIISKQHLATPIAAHGGVVAGFMDGILGVASLSASAENGNLVSTVEFKINYLNPANLGDKLKGTGKVIQKGNKIIVTQGEIFCTNQNRLVATAIGTFNAYPIEKAGIPING